MPARSTTTRPAPAGERTSAVATRPTSALSNFTAEQVQLIKDTVAKGTTDAELAFFLEVARSTGLNPFKRQLHAVMRWSNEEQRNVMAIQTGIDGYRKMAEDSTVYRPGPIEWCGNDGAWTDVWLRDVPPAAARATVYRTDFVDPAGALIPIVANALWKSYAQTKRDGSTSRMWAQFGPLMLGKCAEALAIRRAFPDRTSGLYIDEEMSQSETTEPSKPAAPASGAPSGVAAKVAAASVASAAKPTVVETTAKPNGATIESPRPPHAASGEMARDAEDRAIARESEPAGIATTLLGAPIDDARLDQLVQFGRTSTKETRAAFYDVWLVEHGFVGADPTARWQAFIRAGGAHVLEAIAFFEERQAPPAGR